MDLLSVDSKLNQAESLIDGTFNYTSCSSAVCGRVDLSVLTALSTVSPQTLLARYTTPDLSSPNQALDGLH